MSNNKEEYDLSPSTQYLDSLRCQPHSWHIVLGELIDNSFDAGAKKVEVAFASGRTLSVIDDGHGCDDIEKMLTLGSHYKTTHVRILGRFGVGLKEAACWMWGQVMIKTSKKGRLNCLVLDWNKLSKQSSWKIPKAASTDADGFVGTSLLFRNIEKGFPHDYNKLLSDLSYTFAPALLSGRQIVVKFPQKPSTVCAGWQMPIVTDMVQDEFEINGKHVRLKVGIVPPGIPNHHSGFSYCYGHRIIINTAFGAYQKSVSRICGIVELGDGWTLSKNKTTLVDEDSGLLQPAIYERCQHLLDKSSEQVSYLNNKACEQRVSGLLHSLLRNLDIPDRKEKRDSPQNHTGTVLPTQTGKKRKKATKVQHGSSVLSKCNASLLRMEWEDAEHDEVGRVDIVGNVVYLNAKHPRMAYLKSKNNDDALADHCIYLLMTEAYVTEQKERFPFMREYDQIISAASHVFKHQPTSLKDEHDAA